MLKVFSCNMVVRAADDLPVCAHIMRWKFGMLQLLCFTDYSYPRCTWSNDGPAEPSEHKMDLPQFVGSPEDGSSIIPLTAPLYPLQLWSTQPARSLSVSL